MAKTISKRAIYQGRVISLNLETTRLPNDEVVELEILHHNGGTAILALDQHDRICLLRQYRHAVGDWLWEIPAGKIDPGESPEATAKRELEEEAGVTAQQWQSLNYIIPAPGFCTEKIFLFLAQDLEQSTTAHQTDEAIEVHWFKHDEIKQLCSQGEITDAKTLCALLHYFNRW